MAVTKQTVFDEMREHDYPYWKIMSGKGTSAMFRCNPDIKDVDTQIAMLNSRLAGIKMQPVVDVIISSKTNKEQSEEGGKSFNRLTVILDADESDDGNITINGGFDPSLYASMNDASMKNLKELQEEKHKFEIAKLEFQKDKEIAALKEEFAKLREELMNDDDDDDDSGLGALEPLKPYIPQIIALLGLKMPTPQTMAGTYKTDTSDATAPKVTVEDEIDPKLQQQEIKAAAAISKLLKIDKNAGDALIMLSEFATLSPESYFGFLPLLQSQLDMLKSK
jgi:hypothetical protein